MIIDRYNDNVMSNGKNYFKKNHMKILDLENTITEIKRSLEGSREEHIFHLWIILVKGGGGSLINVLNLTMIFWDI